MEITAIDIINLICSKLGIVANWTEEEVWPYIQELLKEVASGKYSVNLTLAWIFGIVFLVGIIFLIIGTFSFDFEVWYVIGIIFIIIGIIIFIPSICSAIAWKTMPTIKSYEWLFNLLKSA